MQFAAALSRREKTLDAAQEIVDSLRRQMRGEIDLLVLFLSADHRESATAFAAYLRRELSPRVLLGCTCESVLGGDREIEGEPAVSVLAGHLPGVTLTPWQMGLDDWEPLINEEDLSALRRRIGLKHTDDDTRGFILLADPFTTPIVELLEGFDTLTTGIPVLGGMASGAQYPGENVLLLDDTMLDEGVVGVRIAGPIRLDTIVSQGCRPAGSTYLVTKAQDNVIHTLSGRPALEVVQEMATNLPSEEQALLENGLFVGIVINEYQLEFQRGDFLVRNVIQADQSSGAIAIGESVQAGQTVQFHVRDADTADEDLRLLMHRAAQDEAAPLGGLIFTCNGRGLRMFEMPNHDVRAVLDAVPETPLAGFFANGELGPVGGHNFIHGQTASIVLFRPE